MIETASIILWNNIKKYATGLHYLPKLPHTNDSLPALELLLPVKNRWQY